MKQNKVQYSLIPAQGADELIFDFFEPETLTGNIEGIDEQHLKQFQELESVQNFRIVLGKSKEYLSKIVENSSYKKVLKQTLEVAKEDLSFGNKLEDKLTLDQKITNKKSINGTEKEKARGCAGRPRREDGRNQCGCRTGCQGLSQEGTGKGGTLAGVFAL